MANRVWSLFYGQKMTERLYGPPITKGLPVLRLHFLEDFIHTGYHDFYLLPTTKDFTVLWISRTLPSIHYQGLYRQPIARNLPSTLDQGFYRPPLAKGFTVHLLPRILPSTNYQGFYHSFITKDLTFHPLVLLFANYQGFYRQLNTKDFTVQRLPRILPSTNYTQSLRFIGAIFLCKFSSLDKQWNGHHDLFVYFDSKYGSFFSW